MQMVVPATGSISAANRLQATGMFIKMVAKMQTGIAYTTVTYQTDKSWQLLRLLLNEVNLNITLRSLG